MKVVFLLFDFGEYRIRMASALACQADVLLLPHQQAAPHSSLLEQTVNFQSFHKPRMRQLLQQRRMLGTTRAALLSDGLKRELNSTSADLVFAHHLARTDATDGLTRMLYIDTKLWLPDDLLARGDKMSMTASVEARVPFLDHKLVEFAALLQPHLRLRHLTRKYLFKKVSRTWLPA